VRRKEGRGREKKKKRKKKEKKEKEGKERKTPSPEKKPLGGSQFSIQHPLSTDIQLVMNPINHSFTQCTFLHLVPKAWGSV
jgi:hypothetical protein